MLILNSGGTFNKRYNLINGELEVPYDNYAIEQILKNMNSYFDMAGVLYKDSLDMNTSDRRMLANIIEESNDDTFIIVHGTDTMHLTAEFLHEVFKNKKIILTGSMKPFEIDKIESSFNIGMAIGFAKAVEEYGTYICMNGHVQIWSKIVKNKLLGKFEVVK